MAGLLASYFDVLFALNELTHPGEKKLVRIAQERCAKLPAQFQSHIREVLTATATNQAELLENLDRLLDNLDQLLLVEGIDPASTLGLGEDSLGRDELPSR